MIFYRPNSEHQRSIETYLRDLRRQYTVNDKDIRMMDLNTRDAVATASIYDIVSFPGVVVTDNYGAYIMGWNGTLPLMSELMSYYRSNAQ
jgi:hypothetical protein